MKYKKIENSVELLHSKRIAIDWGDEYEDVTNRTLTVSQWININGRGFFAGPVKC
jgi:hypothetical protein